VGSEDAILGCEILILEQEFLIDQSGDVRHRRAHLLSGMRNIHHKLSFLRVNILTRRVAMEDTKLMTWTTSAVEESYYAARVWRSPCADSGATHRRFQPSVSKASAWTTLRTGWHVR